MIELTGASVRLGGKRVFGDVELRVGEGQLVAVLGPNGAGKSTLMRVILGLIRLQTGSVSVLGGPPAQARGAIGYLPQRRGFDPSTRIRGVDLVRLGLDGA
ncbi:MAG: ATP-binding cassette domain-containing protein, partial [Solirubrobacteraceae bacterium]